MLKSFLFNSCVNINCMMSLINHKTVHLHFSNTKIEKAFKSILIHSIEINTHNNINYAVLTLLILKKINEESVLVQMQRKFHLIDNLKINMLLRINVLILERIAVNFHQHQLIIEFYQNFITSIAISSKSHLIKRAFKISDKIIILLRSAILILISNILKKCQL